MICAGLDIGGTKIEARLFDADLQATHSHRVPTPRASADAFFAAVGEQVAWLRERAGADLPIGIAMTGVVEPDTGLAQTANLPISGQPMAERLTAVAGRPLPVMNDSMALAFSEANGGAADGAAAVVGLIFGTGVAAGICVDGRPAARYGGIAAELGHCGMPARALDRHGLGLWRCGCGRDGCIEAYIPGPGLIRLAAHMGLGEIAPPELAARAAGGDTRAEAVLATWADLSAEALEILQMTIDPQIVVLGGGLSQMPGFVERLEAALPARLMPGTPRPILRLARHGDASGVRGAALLARMAAAEQPWTC